MRLLRVQGVLMVLRLSIRGGGSLETLDSVRI